MNTMCRYVNVSKHERRSKLLHNWCKQISQSRTFRSCVKVMCSCKNEIHLANYHKYKLCKDIEKNPSPPSYVDPNKIIAALYSQGNELLFGQNAGQQCIATSLCSLIYNNTKGISIANDLIQIMNIGNMLYSSLSQLTRQAFLMQSELPTLLNMFDIDYRLEYSESFSGTVGHKCAIEGYQYIVVCITFV